MRGGIRRSGEGGLNKACPGFSEIPMTKTCLAIRHVAFEDLGLLGPLVSARGYEISYHDAGIDPFNAGTLVAPDLVIMLGGPIGVYETDAYPFISGEIAAVAARLQTGKPMLGIWRGNRSTTKRQTSNSAQAKR